MADPQTTNKGLFVPLNGADVDSWDVPVNANMQTLDGALGGVTTLNATGLSGSILLTPTQYQPLKLNVTGTPTAFVVYDIPAGIGGIWVVFNNTSGGQSVFIRSNSGGATVNIPAGQNTIVTCDGTAAGMFPAITTTGAAAGADTQVQFNSSGNLGGSAGLTFDGTSLRSTGLNVAGNSILGASSGSTLTLTGTAVAIPNNLNIDGGSLFVNQATGQVGIGITTGLTALLTVAGSIKVTTGGIVFSNGTTQTTAAGPTSAAGSNTQVQFNNSGAFGASANLTFTSGTSTLAVPNAAITALTLNTTGLTQAQANNSTRLATTAYADSIGVQQVVDAPFPAYTTGSNGITADDSIPQISEGDQYMTASITPKSATSKLVIEVTWIGTRVNADTLVVALFQGSTANALTAAVDFLTGAGQLSVISFSYQMTSGTTSATTFTVRAGSNTPAAVYFNGTSSGRLMGGVMASRIRITEVGI